MHRLALAAVGGVFLLGMQSLAWPAAADTAEILEAECHKQLDLNDSGCACIGERAEVELNAKQQDFVVAMVTNNEAEGEKVRATMTAEEMVGAANFMMNIPTVCGEEQP